MIRLKNALLAQGRQVPLGLQETDLQRCAARTEISIWSPDLDLRSANAHYTIGVGYLGLGDTAKAKAELAQAVEISPDLLGARTALATLK